MKAGVHRMAVPSPSQTIRIVSAGPSKVIVTRLQVSGSAMDGDSGDSISGMGSFIDIPSSGSAAAAKLRAGFGELAGFIASAPCLVISWCIKWVQILIGKLVLAVKLHPARAIARIAYWAVFSLLPTLGFYFGFSW